MVGLLVGLHQDFSFLVDIVTEQEGREGWGVCWVDFVVWDH